MKTVNRKIAGALIQQRQKRLRPPSNITSRQPQPGDPAYEEMKRRLQELEDAQRNDTTAELTFKVSEKGGVSVYNLGRFPVTLYYEQWTRLLKRTDDLTKFLEHHKHELKLKNGGEHK